MGGSAKSRTWRALCPRIASPHARRWGFKISAGLLTLGLSAVSCTAILGINEDYHKPDGEMSGAGGAGGSSTTTSDAGSTGGQPPSASAGPSSSSGCTATPCYKDMAGTDIAGLDVNSAGKGICKAGSTGCGSTVCQGAVGPKPADVTCGPQGTDDNCDGVEGDCDTTIIYVAVDGDSPCVGGDAVMSTDPKDLPVDYESTGQFKAFDPIKSQSSTEDLNICTSGGHHRASIGPTGLCLAGASLFKTLGHVSSIMVDGYEQLYELTNGPNVAIIPESMKAQVCCPTSTNCVALPYYVPRSLP